MNKEINEEAPLTKLEILAKIRGLVKQFEIARENDPEDHKKYSALLVLGATPKAEEKENVMFLNAAIGNGATLSKLLSEARRVRPDYDTMVAASGGELSDHIVDTFMNKVIMGGI